jgi:cell division protein FtsB
MRTITFYRSQQGGGAPAFVLLSGSTSGLPFIREFFAEKLNLPVDYFNAFRNVTVAGSADQELVSANAHTLGEVVGSALSQAGEVPVDIELIPESVQKAKDLNQRKPALILALLCLAAFLGALGFFFSKGTEVTTAKAVEIERKADDLKKYNEEIEDLEAALATLDSQQKPFVDATTHRSYWVRVFNYLGEKLSGDAIFFTLLEPLTEGRPIISDDATDLSAVSTGVESTIDSFSIGGLWRENAPGKSQVVYSYFESLKEDAEAGTGGNFFALEGVDISDVIEVDAGTGNNRYAYPFKMVIPLPEDNQVKFSK